MTRPVFNKQSVDYVFRVYYDPDTQICKFKGIGDAAHNLPSMVVDHKTYESIDSCDNYKVADGKLTRITYRTIHKKIELFGSGRFATLKNNLLFAVETNYPGNIDRYDYTSNTN